MTFKTDFLTKTNDETQEIFPYEDDFREITHFEKQQLVHQPILIALDSSGSMRDCEDSSGRENIELASDILARIGSDPDLKEVNKETTDICVMSFSNDVMMLLDWQPLSLYEFNTRLYARGKTALHKAVCEALEAVHRLKASYALNGGIECKRPQIFIITDGFSTDPDDVKEQARAMCRKYVDTKKVTLNFIFLPGSGTSDAKELSPLVKLYKAEDCTHGLPACANFINASIVSFSSSAPGCTTEIELPQWLKTTQKVKTDESGRRTVDSEVEVWN